MNDKDNQAQQSLSEAAVRVEEQLVRFERLLADLARPINTEMALQHARAALEECSTCEERLTQHLTTFAQVIQGLQKRQQRCMELLHERVTQIRARHSDRAALIKQLAQLGQSTSEVNAPIAALANAALDTITPELLASVGEISTRLASAIDEAGQFLSAARQADWTDLARDADALKQQLQSVRSQLLLLGEHRLAKGAPS